MTVAGYIRQHLYLRNRLVGAAIAGIGLGGAALIDQPNSSSTFVGIVQIALILAGVCGVVLALGGRLRSGDPAGRAAVLAEGLARRDVAKAAMAFPSPVRGGLVVGIGLFGIPAFVIQGIVNGWKIAILIPGVMMVVGWAGIVLHAYLELVREQPDYTPPSRDRMHMLAVWIGMSGMATFFMLPVLQKLDSTNLWIAGGVGIVAGALCVVGLSALGLFDKSSPNDS